MAGTLAVLLAAGALLPAVAVAQSGSTSPVIPQSPSSPLSPVLPQASTTTSTTTTPVVTNTNTNGQSGLQGGGIVAITIGAIVVLGGIIYFIWRDARRRAPVRGHAHADAEFGSRRSGSKAPPKPRKLSAAEKRRRKRGRAR